MAKQFKKVTKPAWGDTVTLTKVGLSWTKGLFEKDDNGYLGCTVLIPKTNSAPFKKLLSEIEKVSGHSWKEVNSPLFNEDGSFRDGDKNPKTNKEGDAYDEYAGNYYIKVNTGKDGTPPELAVLKNGKAVSLREAFKAGDTGFMDYDSYAKHEIYAGAEYMALVTPFAYTTKKSGVGFRLKGILKMAEGERIGGGFNAISAFDTELANLGIEPEEHDGLSADAESMLDDLPDHTEDEVVKTPKPKAKAKKAPVKKPTPKKEVVVEEAEADEEIDDLLDIDDIEV